MSDFLAGSLWEARELNRGLQTPSSVSLQIVLYLSAAHQREVTVAK